MQLTAVNGFRALQRFLWFADNGVMHYWSVLCKRHSVFPAGADSACQTEALQKQHWQPGLSEAFAELASEKLDILAIIQHGLLGQHADHSSGLPAGCLAAK